MHKKRQTSKQYISFSLVVVALLTCLVWSLAAADPATHQFILRENQNYNSINPEVFAESQRVNHLYFLTLLIVAACNSRASDPPDSARTKPPSTEPRLYRTKPPAQEVSLRITAYKSNKAPRAAATDNTVPAPLF